MKFRMFFNLLNDTFIADYSVLDDSMIMMKKHDKN